MCFTPFSPDMNDSEWGGKGDLIWILIVFHAAEELQAPVNLAGGRWNANISHDP